MIPYLTMTGTITNKDGTPIDKTHAEWMAHQFLTLIRWCGMEYVGAVTAAHGDDIYRSGVDTPPAPRVVNTTPEKPVRIRYRQREGVSLDRRAHLHVVKSEAEEESALSQKEVFP